MKKILGLIAFIAFLAAAASAQADPVPGWYVGAGAGAAFPTSTSPSVNGTSNKITFDTGWEVLGNFGYSFYNGLRAEAELSEARANADKVNGVSGGTNGRINNLDMFGNLFYDFKTGTRWTPYVGGGIGFADVDADHIGTLSNTGSINDSSLEFAYQGIGGVAYQIDNNWAVTTDYRYIRTTDPQLKTTAGGTVRPENASHNVVISVRYALYAPEKAAPAMPMAEAPAPRAAPVAPVAAPVPQSYMVFFDFDKSVLTPEALSILTAAAEDYKKGSYVRIVLTGHTDTVGTVPYNQKLSERRADAVKKELTKLGVDASQIMATGVGKDGLLVPTADQVREAKNRRAEIVFSKPE